jgi:hypothetical protein
MHSCASMMVSCVPADSDSSRSRIRYVGGQNAQWGSGGVRGSCAAGTVLRSERVLLRGHADPQDCAAGSTAGPQEERPAYTAMSVSRRACVVTGVVAAGEVPVSSGSALGNRTSSRSRDAVWQSRGRGAGRHSERGGRRVVERVPGRGRSEAPSSSARSTRSAGADMLGVARRA